MSRIHKSELGNLYSKQTWVHNKLPLIPLEDMLQFHSCLSNPLFIVPTSLELNHHIQHYQDYQENFHQCSVWKNLELGSPSYNNLSSISVLGWKYLVNSWVNIPDLTQDEPILPLFIVKDSSIAHLLKNLASHQK